MAVMYILEHFSRSPSLRSSNVELPSTITMNLFILIPYRNITLLKKHLIKVHKWPAHKAVAARFEYNLNIERSRLDDNSRKSKVRSYKKRRCPMVFCQKVVVRMDNHLSDHHQLDGKLYKRMLAEAVYVDVGTQDISSNTDNDLSKSVLVEKGLLHAAVLNAKIDSNTEK